MCVYLCVCANFCARHIRQFFSPMHPFAAVKHFELFYVARLALNKGKTSCQIIFGSLLLCQQLPSTRWRYNQKSYDVQLLPTTAAAKDLKTRKQTPRHSTPYQATPCHKAHTINVGQSENKFRKPIQVNKRKEKKIRIFFAQCRNETWHTLQIFDILERLLRDLKTGGEIESFKWNTFLCNQLKW